MLYLHNIKFKTMDKSEILSCYANSKGQSYFELITPMGEIMEIIFDSTYEVDARVVEYYKNALTTIVDAYYKKKEDPTYKVHIHDFICGNLLRNGYTEPFIITYRQDDIRQKIGQKIREIRIEKNLDAKILASQVGIDAGHLSRIEQGKLSVGLDTLGKIVSALGYTIEIVPRDKLIFDPFKGNREMKIE